MTVSITHTQNLVRRATFAAVPLIVALGALSAPAAHAQADLSFTGGNGTPLTLNLADPVTYTMTGSASRIYFILQGAGNNFNGFPAFTSTITYTINNGAPLSLVNINSGSSANNVAASDVYLVGSAAPAVAGDVIVLNAGTLTTNNPLFVSTPAGGSFNTFITPSNAVRASSNGVAGTATAAPEPESLAFLALSGLPVVGIVARRRKAA